MAFIKNMIENAITGSIKECASVGEFLEKIKSQFTGSSKACKGQLPLSVFLVINDNPYGLIFSLSFL
jgi:hypothetical protein